MSSSSNNFQAPENSASKTMPTRSLVASFSGTTSQRALKSMVPSKHIWRGHTGQMVCFLLKVAALVAVQRLSRTRCPFMWRAIQALQVLCCPPFRWMQRWAPLRVLIKGVEKFSRPLLFLSTTTALYNHAKDSKKTLDSVDDLQTFSESTSEQLTSEIGNCNEAPSPSDMVTENWFVQLLVELEKQGMTLPKRINYDELQRFYASANGDFLCFVSSVKKTIRWREIYNILSSQELEMWSHLVFWHGFDLTLRPCLIIRLGLACSSLAPHDRPRFSQAVVSQIEHGVLHLINGDDSQITVLMDCEGLSPIKFPMHMMKSCSTLVQDHYPNRLGALFVIRLPPVVQALAHAFIQDLNPTTRQKVYVEGESCKKVLSRFLQMVPAFLGGDCTCSRCKMPTLYNTQKNESWDLSDEESEYDAYPASEHYLNGNCEHVLRVVIVAFLLLWVFIAFLAGMNDPESLSSLHA